MSLRIFQIFIPFVLVICALVACSDPEPEPRDLTGDGHTDAGDSMDIGGDLDAGPNDSDDTGDAGSDTGDASDTKRSEPRDTDAELSFEDVGSDQDVATDTGNDEDASLDPAGPEPHGCPVLGDWSWHDIRVETNPDTPCSVNDCGHGNYDDCSTTSLATAYSDGGDHLEWEITIPGILGDYEGTIDDDGQFSLVNEYYPETTMEGRIDTDCELWTLIDYQSTDGAGNPSCEAELEYEGEKM